MRYILILILTGILLTLCGPTYGQGIYSKSANNVKQNRLMADSVLGAPRDTGATNLATYQGSPVGDSGRIAYMHGKFWGYRNLGGVLSWFELGAGTTDLSSYWDSTVTKQNFPIDTVFDISALQAYTGKAKILLVTDQLRGGLFFKRATGTDNAGTVFTGAGGRIWWRAFDEFVGLNVCWFGAKGDGTTDDTGPITDAIAAVSPGGKIFFPNRSFSDGKFYKIASSITVNKAGIKIYSDGEIRSYSTTIQATSGTFPLFTVTAPEVGFWGISLRGNGTFSILDPSGAGRWGQGATVSGIRVEGDAGANGDLKVNYCTFVYLDSAMVFKARNADISNNLISQTKHPIVILDATTGQQRGFKIQNNWVHSPGDTTIGRAFVKCVDQNAFQIWIQNNQLDGQPNCMLADIMADSAVQITDNNVSLGRGGLVSLTGVRGGQVSNNYFLGGSYKTRGNGVLLTNCQNVSVSNNTILQPANTGISLVNGDNCVITNNNIKDFSWQAKDNAGNFDGISIDASSTNNSVYTNQLHARSGAVYDKMIDYDATLPAPNHVAINDQYKGATFESTRGIEFGSQPKSNGYFFAPYDVLAKWDISYSASDSVLLFNKTGVLTPLRMYPNGNLRTDYLFDNSLGTSNIGVGFGNGYIRTISNAGGSGGAFFQYIALGSADNILQITGPSATALQKLVLGGDSVSVANPGNTAKLFVNGNTVWHSGNDGVGSGLDADLLDGLNASAFTKDDGTSTAYIRNTTTAQSANFNISGSGTFSGTTPIARFVRAAASDVNFQHLGTRFDINNPNATLSITGVGNFIVNGTTPNSKFEVVGSNGRSITTVTGNTTIGEHHTILVNNSGSVTITLPAAATCTGRIYVIKKISAAANDVIVDGAASETIDGNAAGKTLTAQYSSMTIQCNGTTWFIISLYTSAAVL